MEKQLKNGHKDALKEAYTLYGKKVYYVAYSYTKCKVTAEDITQDVFVKIWKKRDKINTELPLEQQLFVITKNLIFDYFRKRVVEEKSLLNYKVQLQNNTIEDHDNDQNFNIKKMHSLISKLPKQQQNAIRMYRFQGLTYQEIAKALNISVNTVSVHIASGMRFLKNNVA